MLDFINSTYKRYIASISAVLLGAMNISIFSGIIPSQVTQFTIWIAAIAMLGGVFVFLKETN